MGFKPRQQRVTVHWADACGYDGWARENDDRQTVACVTRGWLLKRTREHFEVACTVGEPDGVNQVMVIPRTWIVKVEYNR